MIRIVFFIVFVTAFASNLIAQDTIVVAFNKTTFTQKDTLEAEVLISTHYRKKKAQTLNLIIENTQTHQQWKYRYPMLGNTADFALAINEKLPDGAYAFNFFLQPDFFSIRGKLDRKKNNDRAINYLMTFKNKESIIDVANVDEDGSFRINNMLFEDSGFIVFSPAKRKIQNTLDIKPVLTLDSTYTPLALHTEFIVINKTKAIDTIGYQYKYKNDKTLLEEIIVTAKGKTLLKQFEEEHVSGMFNSFSAMDFDGLSSDEISSSPDLFMFLQGRVAGITMGTDAETGLENLTWRKQEITFYVNEMEVTDFAPNTINTSDIALIKVFRPGSSVGTKMSSGGVVSIYTKSGKYATSKNGNHHFYFKGYNALQSDWK